MAEAIKENMEEMKKLLVDFQDEHKRLDASDKKNSEALIKMGLDMEKFVIEHQKAVLDLAAEKKAREELELAVARGSSIVTKDGEIKSNPEYKRAYRQYLRNRKSIPDEIFDAEFKKMLEFYDVECDDENQFRILKAMSVGSNPDGGYFVTVERLAQMSKRRFETSPMRRRAQIITTATEAVEQILDDDEFGVQTPGELDPRTQTVTGKIGLITIPVCEHTANVPVTQKLMDDAAFNIDSYVMGKVDDKFGRKENQEFVNGSGNKECEGFLTLADWITLGAYERNKLETRYTSSPLGIAGDDLLDLQSDLIEDYQNNANWCMHRKIWVEVMKLKDLNGQYLLNPMMLFSGAELQLLGKPVDMYGDMPKDLDEDNIIIAYGDFRTGYLIVDRMGIRVLRDPYTIKGLVQFYCTKRTGGGVQSYQSIKRLRVQGS